MDKMLNAKVTIRFRFNNVCTNANLKEENMSLTEMVKFCLDEEGLQGCLEDEFEIVSVRRAK